MPNNRTTTRRLRTPRWLFLPAALLLSTACFAQSAKNPGVVEITHPETFTRILAVSDTHGMYARLLNLLGSAKVIDARHHWFAGKTLLMVCGDSIDKGHESLPILRLWQRLIVEAPKSGGRVVVLLGNHEAEFLHTPTDAKSLQFQRELAQAGTTAALVATGKDAKGIGNFLLSMPLAARAGTYLFSHAGWYPDGMNWQTFSAEAKTLLRAGKYGDDFLTGPHSILEEKDEIPARGGEPVNWYDDPSSVQGLEKRLKDLGLYGGVFGHKPHAFGFVGTIGSVDNRRLLKIDSGMSPLPAGDGSLGEILCFPHPADLLHLAPPAIEGILPDGSHVPVQEKTITS